MTVAVGRGTLRSLRRLARETHGVSAVEFALILPLLLTLYLGGTEITQGITIKRKTIIATRTLGDLVAQSTTINDTQMNAIFDATTAVLAPYPGTKLDIVISSVSIDASGAATVAWSEARNGGTARATSSSVTLPTGTDTDGNSVPSFGLKNANVILTEASYTYTPTIGYVISGSIDLKDKLYLRPRLSGCIHRVKSGQTIKCSWES